ncbi:hypothetical protein TPAU25S_01001 [Tsukamurella paurometabola]|uniref:DUF1990 domain-containing protein n=1 Tax=Tsukamurella paurometabola (strain ATCC 8368 / DSM 20162 / CCUG 35730 / CIP 100753 / JCM 10117 / KCTC 9821 / NBRC 16120 / NCIMB 702349 / NCTC 13040) TaxID=521096 RepID=D5UQD7_TSUPD|nr:DUF1990 domain-containing protein [Tsukamurella paurometabola]ADG78907.1 Domain of unknown function DUF1990 [Tsukamurella paurometabola DSM 20162]SUP33478.1 Uncharacterized protein conserved in bacteria [Tsukamurella paurometabola]
MTDFAVWERAPFTYPEVGSTRPGSAPPPDAHAIRAQRVVGHGPEDFAAVRDEILQYGMQRGAGMRVRASTPAAHEGTVLLLSATFLGPITIPCRVIYVLDEPRRAGFAYGTLPGHPESGEELFSVELRPDDAVVAVISAFSRPGRWYTRLGAPAGRLVQAVMTRRYLSAVEQR